MFASLRAPTANATVSHPRIQKGVPVTRLTVSGRVVAPSQMPKAERLVWAMATNKEEDEPTSTPESGAERATPGDDSVSTGAVRTEEHPQAGPGSQATVQADKSSASSTGRVGPGGEQRVRPLDPVQEKDGGVVGAPQSGVERT